MIYSGIYISFRVKSILRLNNHPWLKHCLKVVLLDEPGIDQLPLLVGVLETQL